MLRGDAARPGRLGMRVASAEAAAALQRHAVWKAETAALYSGSGEANAVCRPGSNLKARPQLAT